MKLIHLSDLHLGKWVNGFSMLEDQEYILTQILHIVDSEQPSAMLIAGDVYDKSVPSGEAVQVFDEFLYRLVKQHLPVFLISGNHDSPERLSFCSRMVDASGIHIAPVFDGSVSPITLEDEHGQVDIFLLPFLKPVHVRRYYPDQAIDTYTDAIRTIIRHMDFRPASRNVLVTHQFVAGGQRCESEDPSVGGLDCVDASVLAPFDYVALGHLHAPQSLGSPRVRYCGSPLKYSFSEANHTKSVSVAELGPNGSLTLRAIPLTPKRDLRQLRGSYLDLTSKSSYEHTNRDDYIHITLTDEEDVFDAVGKLRAIYPNLMKLDYDNRRTRTRTDLESGWELPHQTPLELFSQLYERQNNQPMSQEQLQFSQFLIQQIWGEHP